MPPPVIKAGPFTLRPFRDADIAWVCEVSQDPAIQGNLPQVFASYRIEHAAYFVQHMTRAAWADGRRAEFLVEGAGDASRLGRVGLDLRPYEPGAADLGYWMARPARGRGAATAAVRALCRWAFAQPALALDLIEWHCEVGNVASRRGGEKGASVTGAPPRPRLRHRGTRVDAWVGSRLRTDQP